jgi:hypothetical protein
MPYERFRGVQTRFRYMTQSSVTTFAADHEGLYMEAMLPFRVFMPRIFVQWSDITVAQIEGVFLDRYEFRFTKVPNVYVQIPKSTALPLLDYSQHASMN